MSQPILLLLAHAGRLLLEYNESTGEIHRTLSTTARTLTDDQCDFAVAYGGVAVEMSGSPPLLMPVRELRYNAALQVRLNSILQEVQAKHLDPNRALTQLQRIEADTFRHNRWLTVILLALAANSLAALLGADFGAIITSGVATGLALLVRQECARLHASVLAMPLAGGFVGGIIGGVAIRFGYTHTPQLALIVPSLMLVPGPHLINALLDLVDNYVPMSLARFALACAILFAVTIGVFLGAELAGLPSMEERPTTVNLNVWRDMLLAGLVTVGFAAYYNTAWPHLGMATIGGMAGHGLRFLALESGWGMVPATFAGGLAVGVIAAWIASSYRVPLAVIAFAGAVTMMPGIQIYRALTGTLRLARLHETAAPSLVEGTLGNAFQACLIVVALSTGLILAARAVRTLMGERPFP